MAASLTRPGVRMGLGLINEELFCAIGFQALIGSGGGSLRLYVCTKNVVSVLAELFFTRELGF